MHLQLNNFTQKLDFGVFCGLGEENREEKKRIKREKEEKKGKNLIAAKSRLVGMKGYHKTYNRVKYFLP